MRMRHVWVCGALASVAFVELLAYSPPALGWTLFFLMQIALYFLLFGLKERIKLTDVLLLIAVVGLAVPYSLFNNATLRAVNMWAIAFCMIVLYLRRVVPGSVSWDKPRFYLEALLGGIARPFAFLVAPWKEVYLSSDEEAAVAEEGAAVGHVEGEPDGEMTRRRRRRTAVFQIVLACLVAVPLLTILGTLLYHSDAVFASFADTLARYLRNLNIGEIAWRCALSLMVLPFFLSTFWSYAKRELFFITPEESDVDISPEQKRTAPAFPSVFSATLLVLINLLYALYAVVQFRFLFAGAQGVLPIELTYAEYARRGFFELAALSAFNVILIFIGSYATKREGRLGTALRVLIITLVALSTVQIVSAFTRMNLYVRAFGLSELRLFVSAFMLLIVVIFALFIVRELAHSKGAVPVFKATVGAALVLLLALNYMAPDAFIARYNIDGYLSGQLKAKKFDFNYYAHDLSFDAGLVLLQNEARLTGANVNLAKNFQKYRKELAKIDVPKGVEPDRTVAGYMARYYDFEAEGPEEALQYYFNRAALANWKAYNLGVVRFTQMVDR